MLFYDGSGLCLYYKRLDDGTFRIPEAPRAGVASIVIAEHELDALLDGIDLAQPAKRRYARRVH